MITLYVTYELIVSKFVVKVKNIPLVREIPAILTVVGGPKLGCWMKTNV
jgi:hypothetical protein